MADVELLVIKLTLGITYSIIYHLHINESVSLSQEKVAHEPERSGAVGQPLGDSENFHHQETRVNIGKRMREQINTYRTWREEHGPGDKVSWGGSQIDEER